MADLDRLEIELRELIVDALALEDVRSEDIAVDAPLFGDGLGLDSIDALELAMAIARRYGVEMSEDNDQNRTIFGSVRNLAAFVREHRTDAGSPS